MKLQTVVNTILIVTLVIQLGAIAKAMNEEVDTGTQHIEDVRKFMLKASSTISEMDKESHLLHEHIYATAKHIPIKEVEEETGFKFLYAEEDTDRAFYLDTKKGFLDVGKGIVVGTVEGAEGVVTISYEGEFEVDLNKTEVEAQVGDAIIELDTGLTLGIIYEKGDENSYKVRTVN